MLVVSVHDQTNVHVAVQAEDAASIAADGAESATVRHFAIRHDGGDAAEERVEQSVVHPGCEGASGDTTGRTGAPHVRIEGRTMSLQVVEQFGVKVRGGRAETFDDGCFHGHDSLPVILHDAARSCYQA